MPPKRYGCLIVVGDPPGGIGGVDRSGQCIEQLSKPAFALAQTDVGPGAINRHNIFACCCLTKCGDRSVKFTLKKSDRLFHFPAIPPHAKLATGAPRILSPPSENSGAVKKLRRLRQIFSRLMARLNEACFRGRASDFPAKSEGS